MVFTSWPTDTMKMLLTPALGMQQTVLTSYCFFTSTGPDFIDPLAPQGLHRTGYSHRVIPVRCGIPPLDPSGLNTLQWPCLNIPPLLLKFLPSSSPSELPDLHHLLKALCFPSSLSIQIQYNLFLLFLSSPPLCHCPHQTHLWLTCCEIQWSLLPLITS